MLGAWFAAWTLTLDAVGRYYERVLTRKADLQSQATPPGPLLEELMRRFSESYW